MPADTLYEKDIVAWAEQQELALRDCARLHPELSNRLDWGNLAEEIGDMGRSEVHKFTSLLRQFFIHMVKALSVADSQARLHWLAEAIIFRADFISHDTRSLRRKFDLDEEWRSALRAAELALQAHGDRLAVLLTPVCPFTLDELCDKRIDPVALLDRVAERLSAAANGRH